MMIEKQALKHRKIILACECNPDGSQDSTCTDDGKCSCKPNFTGDKCDMCAEGFFNFQKCEGKNTNGSWTFPLLKACFFIIILIPNVII